MDKQPRLEINYVVTRWDVISMYLGSWGARLTALPGIVLMVMAILSWSSSLPMGEKVEVLGVGLVSAAAAPAALVYYLCARYRTLRIVGGKVRLVVDESGVHGWPVAPYQDRSWPRMGKARRLRGVITLPFHQFGTRAGWVPVPERALTAEQLAMLKVLLAGRGLN